MKRRVGLIRKCMLGALLSSVAWAVPGMQAQAGDLPVKAPAAEPIPYWWFHGEVEAGGRFFLNNPTRNGSAYLNQQSLAKYYEYSSIKPGPFSNIWLSTGSKDGLYQIDLGGKNIGYSDQNYYLNASKAGEQYFNVGWDETPHVYSTSAQTPYLGVGTDALTLPSGLLSNTLMTTARLNPYLNQTDVGIKRDTGSVDYRWTPTDAWDIKTDYSHLRRTGTQVDGLTGFLPQTGTRTNAENPTQVTRPVKDSTQNYGLNGEYAGTTSWGKVTFKAGYTGSQYTDDYQSYTVQNPYCVAGVCPQTGTAGSGYTSNGFEGQFARMSLWPSNQANGFNGTVAADLPFKSRYVGTVGYTMMRQNSDFQPMSTAAAYTLPASSLNGAINTTLINNVITTQITPELKSKLSYRYYDFQNNTQELLFAKWISQDQSGGTVQEISIRSLAPAYTKQNAGTQLNWRPLRELNLTAEYGFEQYNYVRMDADATYENSGKLSADWKPTNWTTLRTSGYFADRRYNNYDHLSLAAYQFPGTTLPSPWTYLANQRQFMFANRQRTKANVAFDIVALPGVTITPNYKYQDDDYGLNPANQIGLNASRTQGGGVDVGYVPNRDLSFVFGYLREHYDQSVYGYSSASRGFGATLSYPIGISAKDTVDTFTFAMNYAAIPDQLDLNLRYMASNAVDSTTLMIAPRTNGGTAQSTTPVGGQWTDVTTWHQRVDATATYKFDPTVVAQMGWKGDVKARLRYTWERNSVSNWQNDSVQPFYSPDSTTQSPIWLASDNPNYNVHMMAVSLVASW